MKALQLHAPGERRRLPLVLTQAEPSAVLSRLNGVPTLMAQRLYGAGVDERVDPEKSVHQAAACLLYTSPSPRD